MKAYYTSVWDDGFEITTICDYNPETKIVSNIDSSDCDTTELDILTDEYIEFENQQLRKKDGVTFEY